MDFSPSKNTYAWNQLMNFLWNYKYMKVRLEKDHVSEWSKELSLWKFVRVVFFFFCLIGWVF